MGVNMTQITDGLTVWTTFVQTNSNENIKVPHYWHFLGGGGGGGGSTCDQ